jgi:murein DD-endopeptidase MepM/ murein hydrolase activator NlpD
VDFADRLNDNQTAIEGRAVLAVLSGRVAAVTANRFPYGNAIMIETRLDEIPSAWQEQLHIPTPAPTLAPHPVLTCPPMASTPAWEGENRSLYLLYAHLKEPASLQPDDPIDCGQEIGAIGSSGNALNPHLHLETRVGPAGARFASLAHYDSSATPEEMANYCIWRVSNLFQLVDPMRLLSMQP